MLSSADSDGVPRRARGALESAVMDLLWQAGRPLSPGEVRDELARSGGDSGDGGRDGVTDGGSGDSAGWDLSYSTVVTILTRLHAKKMLVRTRVGRSFQYAPLADEAGLAARRLTALLDNSADREAVLSRFVADLPDSDEELLRRLLGSGSTSGSSPRSAQTPGTASETALDLGTADDSDRAEGGESR